MAICGEERIQTQASTVKRMVGDYLEIVHITMRDLAPKYIMYSLVLALQNYLDDELVGDLLKRHPTAEAIEQLMQWENSGQVPGLLASKEAVCQALEVVGKFSQN